MTRQEYEQKREQEWKAFCNRHGMLDRGHVIIISAFFDAFDRAYALGKQEKDGIDLKKLNEMLDDTLKKETKESLNQWLSEKNADTVISGWVAIDEAFNECYLHTNKPTHENIPIADTGDYESHWRSKGQTYLLDEDLFPDMDSDSEPQECEITIKRKKK